jgi:hypothetical protein
MKVLFLDIDGVLNSYQSATFWHSRRNQAEWENQMYKDWPGTLKEYIAMEFCPIAFSNLEELVRKVPDVKIVVSSTWRMGETVETMKKILAPSKLVSDAVFDLTKVILEGFREVERGHEIQEWLDRHPETKSFVILDDDDDMCHLKPNLVLTDVRHGFQYSDMLKVAKMLDPNAKKSGAHFL